ncbi:MAG TPA: hypothetical protein VMB05_02645 [Solirubrobacteraceae bacterium]|nr:hypothetical protein [Solirubrobacteraceae bacterium]
MRVFLLVGLAATFVSSAFAAFAAAVGPPEFGTCSPPLDLPEGSGQYMDESCTEPGGNDRYEWYPRTGGEFIIAKGKTKVATQAGTFECTEAHSIGMYTSPKTVNELQIRLRGCKLGAAQCSSSGAAAGEVNTSTLEGVLGFAEVAGPRKTTQRVAAFELSPPSATPFAEFSCGASAIVLQGAPIGTIAQSTKVRTLTMLFKAKKGAQTITHLEGMTGQPLESSVNAGPFAPSPIKSSLKNLNFENILVNTAV